MRPLTIFVLCLTPTIAHAQSSAHSDDAILARAEAAFKEGVASKERFLQAQPHFSESANQYLALHRHDVRSSALYRSLGNAALLADRWPESIWAYHMGLRLDPNDARMREHLVFARAKVLYPPGGEGRLDADTWPTWLHRPTVMEVFWIWIIAYSLACVAATLALVASRTVDRQRAGARLWLALTAGMIAIAAGVALWHENQRAEMDRDTPLVIVAANTNFYLGNAASYPQHASLPRLPRGLEVRQIHRRGDWLQVRLTTGEIGWLPVSRVLIVEP